jgi:hypothetical protein
VKRRILSALALSILSFSLIAGTTLAAWGFAFPINVVDTSATGRTYVPVLTGVTGASLASSGYMTATGTDTNMQIGSTSVPYMLSTTQIATVVPTLGAGSQATLNLYTGYSPVQTDFSIIVGQDGYITIPSEVSDDMQLGDDFEIEFDGYVDTSSGSDKNLVYKEGSLALLVLGSENVVVSILGESFTTPTGHEDPESGWSSEANAYDDDTGTSSSTSTDISATSWSEYLEFKIDSSTIYGVRSWITSEGGDADFIGVDYYDGEWHSIYEGASASGAWVYKEAFAESVTKARIRLYNGSGAGCWGRIYEFDFDTGLAASVSSVTSGEHTIKAYADATNLGIIIDEGEAGEDSDTTPLSGGSVTDNANDIVINQNNVMPYFDYLKWTVNDTLIAWYQPVGMITATTLPDRQGDAENGTITWGSNSDLTVTMGSVTGSESPEAGEGEQSEISYSVPSPNIPSGWFGGGVTTLPFYDNFLQVSSDTGIPVKTMYTFMIFSVAMAVGFGTFIVFKPMIFGFIATLAVLWAGSSMGVIPGWVIFSLIVCGFGIIYMRRQV